MESGVLVVLGGVVGAARKDAGDGGPLVAIPRVGGNDDDILDHSE